MTKNCLLLLLFSAQLLLLLLFGCSGHDDKESKEERIRAAAKRLLMSLRAAAPAAEKEGEAATSALVSKRLFENDDDDDDGKELLLETMITGISDFVKEEERHREEETDCQDDGSYYADRHLAEILNTFNNHDCLEREFDVRTADPSSFDTDAAREVFEKCHILVLRNVFPKQEIRDLHSRFSNYIGEVYTGKLKSKKGTATTHGGDSFVLHEGNKRWNILPPKSLITRNIFANPVILEILSAPSILGDDLVVNHIGNINAEAGALAQGWHADGTYLHGEDSLQVLGVAGHDLPPYAVNIFTPLLDMTNDLGPTEFCLGTSNLRGLAGAFYHVHDDRLLENGIAEALRNFDQQRVGPCPAGFNRIPLLNMGDVVLVDYMMTHRGGTNRSSLLRSLLFITYSRKWYHDSNFDISYNDDGEDDDWLTRWTRFALVEKVDEEESCPKHDDSALPPLESISGFLQAYDGWDDEEVEQNYYQDG